MKVFLIMAQTLDGHISRNSSEFIDWTGSADKKMFVQVTKEAGVIIMGSKTFDTIGKPLPGRKNIVLTRNKKRVSDAPDLVFTAREPRQLLSDLEGEGYSSAAVIGGSQINTLFARANLIDDIYITIAPRIFGQGLSLFNVSLDLRLRLVSTRILEEDYVLLHYSVK
ncbi:dihydrofolate reductase family protein [Desulfopila inferna]|uniref:dihydrofolate reductase family protein n=1 Tax=Desulfopila inferna TaxID=468528 RepID=UPI00196549D5|nr:dihydrofolate reductase family protein [Desulfopila inferna]MBM9604081.1 dihydrofolate reductase [Desulfopila inferna]